MRLKKLVQTSFLVLLSIGLYAQDAPGAPGAVPTWTAGSKDGVGTATTNNSRVWFTLEGGVLSEVYYPQLDSASLRTLEFAVSDGRNVWIESRDLLHAIERANPTALSYRQTSSDPAGRFKITKTYATDPRQNTLLIDVTFTSTRPYSLYVLSDPALKNTGFGDTGLVEDGALVAEKPDIASALLGSAGFVRPSVGFAGVSDGYTDLMMHGRLKWSYRRAENGNVVQTAGLSGAHFTLAVGFGATAAEAIAGARASLKRGFAAVNADYVQGWRQYVRGLRQVAPRYAPEFQLAAMVLKAHEDKTFPGAMIASMSVPWGFASKADVAGVGGYHLVWARDLYEMATAFIAAGDRAAAERSLDYLLKVQQKPDGSFPQNSWLDGRPYWTVLQMDEVSYPWCWRGSWKDSTLRPGRNIFARRRNS